MHELKKKNIGGNYSPAANLHLTLAFIGGKMKPETHRRAIYRTAVHGIDDTFTFIHVRSSFIASEAANRLMIHINVQKEPFEFRRALL
jgi:hypothetical protein